MHYFTAISVFPPSPLQAMKPLFGVMLEVDYLKLRKFANDRGIPEEEPLTKFLKDKVRGSGLELITPEERQKIIKDAFKDHQ